jgi:hypothetical protein
VKNIPQCFDSEDQYKQWGSLASLSGLSKRKICADCTPDYRDRMTGAGRCANPQTVFVIDKGGATVGVTPEEKGWFRAVTGHFEGNGKLVRSQVVAMASPTAIIEELRRRKKA